MPPFAAVFVLLLLSVTTTGILLARTWRWLVLLLAAQYSGVFILVLQHLPLGMAAVKAIAGWMSAAILAMTCSNFDDRAPFSAENLPQGRLFRLLAAALVALIAFTAAPQVSSVMGDAGAAIASAGLLLAGMGLLHLGMTDQPLRVTAGLMTVLAGFETLYAAVENAVLVAALLAVINLGLALTGAYLMTASYLAESLPPQEEEVELA